MPGNQQLTGLQYAVLIIFEESGRFMMKNLTSSRFVSAPLCNFAESLHRLDDE